ncbi:MAG: type II toxin-antitoxin system Phd/YefM family antitoxin [Thermoflexales bacterium]
MRATIVDLRYRMRDVLKALDKNQRVTVIYRGKVKGTIVPVQALAGTRAQDHAFFGMRSKDTESVEEIMTRLRGGRY